MKATTEMTISWIAGNSEDVSTQDVKLTDESYEDIQLMTERVLVLKIRHEGYLDIPVGAACSYNGTGYYLLRPADFVKNGERDYEYTMTMYSNDGLMSLYMFRNPVDGRLKFDISARPEELLQMVVDNMNMHDFGWKAGDCIKSLEKLVSFNHVRVNEALKAIADTFDTEFIVSGRTVSLGKIEYNKSYDDALHLSYGKGKGFVPGLGRSNYDDSSAFSLLYVQGGDRNIDFSKYGHKTLLLPSGQKLGYDGNAFDYQQGFVKDSARWYVASDDGTYITRADRTRVKIEPEESYDASECYPKRVGKVTEWITDNAKANLYSFRDSSIPSELDYNACQIAGQNMTVIFQSGMLSGREFDVSHYNHLSRTFSLVKAEIDGVTMPDNDTWKAAPGDEYAVYGCMLPAAYIRNDSDRSGGSWDMFRQAARYMYENEDSRFTFSCELDGYYAERNWNSISGKIKPGGMVWFTDKQFLPDGDFLRITGIKTYLYRPFAPELSLSNAKATGSLLTTLNEFKGEEVIREKRYRDSLEYTRRRWRDLKETTDMLENSMLGFDKSVSPVTVRTMQLIAGDESLQFRFVTGREAPVGEDRNVSFSFNSDLDRLSIKGGLKDGAMIIQHMTLGINSIGSVHADSEYRFWDIPAFTSDELDPDTPYYLYARVSQEGTGGTVVASASAVGMTSEAGFLHLLIGILNSEFELTRSFSPMYGYSEVSPGRVVTEKIVASDGINYFNLSTGDFHIGNAAGSQFIDFDAAPGKMTFRGAVQIEAGSTGLDNFDGWKDIQEQMSEYEYLRKALPEATTEIAGGIVLANVIGVKDEDGKIVAGLTPGTLGLDMTDKEQDPMLFAGSDGITKIDDSLFMVSKSGWLRASSGRIGGISIYRDHLGIGDDEAAKSDGLLYLSRDLMKFRDDRSKVIIGTGVLPASTGAYGNVRIEYTDDITDANDIEPVQCVYIKCRPAVSLLEPDNVTMANAGTAQEAACIDGNVRVNGAVAVFHDGFSGVMHSDTVLTYWTMTHRFFFTRNTETNAARNTALNLPSADTVSRQKVTDYSTIYVDASIRGQNQMYMNVYAAGKPASVPFEITYEDDLYSKLEETLRTKVNGVMTAPDDYRIYKSGGRIAVRWMNCRSGTVGLSFSGGGKDTYIRTYNPSRIGSFDIDILIGTGFGGEAVLQVEGGGDIWKKDGSKGKISMNVCDRIVVRYADSEWFVVSSN